MSKPKMIKGYGAAELEALLKKQLTDDAQPLRQTIGKAVEKAEAARTRSRKRVSARAKEMGDDEAVPTVEVSRESPSELFRKRQESAIPPATVPPSKAHSEREPLRRLADIGLREFNAQLYVVQSKPEL